jgi:hypothetical protein
MNIKEAQTTINDRLLDIINTCPHCSASVHIEQLWNDHHKFRNGDTEFYVMFRCKPCKKLMLKTFLFEQNRFSKDINLSSRGWKKEFPTSLDDSLTNEEKEFFPPNVLCDYEEALNCQSIGAHRASCAMFRRSLQSALLVLGADYKLDLIKQIFSLDSLPSDVKDWAHQIRIFGNWGSHPDKDNLKEITLEDVSETHDFISKFLMYTFIMPEKVKISRTKREEKLNKQKQQ